MTLQPTTTSSRNRCVRWAQCDLVLELELGDGRDGGDLISCHSLVRSWGLPPRVPRAFCFCGACGSCLQFVVYGPLEVPYAEFLHLIADRPQPSLFLFCQFWMAAHAARESYV